MKNFQQNGERLRLFPAIDVKAGDLVVVGELAGVAFNNYEVADGDGVVCSLTGVFGLTKDVGAWTQGQPLYGKEGETTIYTTSAGNVLIGHAADATTNDATEGPVRLKG